MTYRGWTSLCMRATDLESSKKFYESAGLKLISEVPGKSAILGFGGFRLALMTFLDENSINIRGADVARTQARVSGKFPELKDQPVFYSAEEFGADADGCCWTARDPDGNMVFFDTNANETGSKHVSTRTTDVLDGAIQELSELGADDAILAGLKRLRKDVNS